MALQRKPRRQGSSVLSVHRIVLAPVAEPTTDGEGTPKEEDRSWGQIAAEGTFKGYPGINEFKFDKATFDKIVANFRRNPNYKKGSDGVGCENVIAWDFHHASEMPATEGAIPFAGAPAQGWVQDLSVRMGTDGKAQLWALTKWLEPAKTYLQEGRYQWASVSITFDAVDAISGLPIGPLLTSVALTNQPFIEGMQKLAASKYWRNMYLEPADSPEKALEMIRGMLGMPETASASDVLGELAKVQTWVSSGSQPLGVDLDEIIGGLRTILNLPALSTSDEVFVEVAKLVARLTPTAGVESTPGAQPTTPQAQQISPPTGSPMPGLTKPPKKDVTMELVQILASKLGIQANQDLVVTSVEELVALRDATIGALKLSKGSANSVILKAVMDDSAVRAKYGPILEALGVTDPGAAFDRIASLMSESAKLAEMTPEFAALKVKAAEVDQAAEEQDTEDAVEVSGIAATSDHYASLKAAILSLRKHDKKTFDEKYRQKIDSLRAARKRPDAKVLTSRISAQGASAAGGTDSPKGGTDGNPAATDVSNFDGPNLILKTVNFVRATVPGAQGWTWEVTHQHAVGLVRKGLVTAG